MRANLIAINGDDNVNGPYEDTEVMAVLEAGNALATSLPSVVVPPEELLPETGG